MEEPSMLSAYRHSGKRSEGRVVSNTEIAELRALVEKQQRQIRTLARACGQTEEPELSTKGETAERQVDPKKFGNTESLKHGMSSWYDIKPFRELEEELKEEGGELKLPNSIYTVAICAGFFCDGNVWDAIEARAMNLAAQLTGPGSRGGDDASTPRSPGLSHISLDAREMSHLDIVKGTLKNVWLMFVNAFVLLFFHYWLTFSVLYYLYIHPYDSDPEPWDEASDLLRMEHNNETHPWNFKVAWNSHFVQGECETDIWLRGICASLFACFVYFDMLQTFTMLQWLYWAPHDRAGIAEGRKTSWFFPDELKVRIIPSPFSGRAGDVAEREIVSRIPPLYRFFMVFIVVIPKIVIGTSLLFFGGKLVLRSENNPEVIMNSLAAYFVAEMDEYVYSYLCPTAIQTVLEDEESFPPLNKKTPSIDILPDPQRDEQLYRQRKQLVDGAIASFHKFDGDADGELDEDELDDMLSKCGITLSIPQVRQVIAYCDNDRSGTVSLKELTWLLTCQDDIASQLDFNDPPDVKRWLQKEFLPKDPKAAGWRACWREFMKTLAPIIRIVVIMGLTLALIVNYCDDLNPLDNLRARVNTTRD